MMKRIRLASLGILLAAAWLMLPSGAWADDNSARKQDSQGQQTSQQNNQNRHDQSAKDDDETEYRGMEHAALGVMLSERQGQGVRIRDVMPDSPADRAGLRPNDRITKIDDKAMNSYRDVIHYINHVQPGQAATITVHRDGEDKSIHAKFATREEIFGNDEQASAGQTYRQRRGDQQNSGSAEQSQTGPANGHNGQQAGGSQLGSGENSRNQMAQHQQLNRWSYRGRQSGERAVLGIDLENKRGAAIVHDVRNGSPAEQAGLRSGDEITAIDGQRIQDQNDAVEELEDRQPGEQVELTIFRNGRQRHLHARLTSEQELARQESRDRSQDNGHSESQGDDRNQHQTGDRSNNQSHNSNRNDNQK